ncbi:MAG: aerobic-type carbon monoxide dehydrogenase small subunit (CoxS/CutS family) [Halieaceae bacterium]|jgi:aerobic-type carbon monoxide dehydrogenase small subunit (CoxS/CutS family)
MEDLLEQSVLIALRINGKAHDLEVMPGMSLLEVLRDELRITGPHMGCMTGHCGACTVMIDGRISKSCITQAATLPRAEITTIEGLRNADGTLNPVQQAFWDKAGFQCGYCAPGFVLSTIELLSENNDPSDDDIDAALAGSLCRCTGYRSIVRSVKAAAQAQREEDQS